MIARNAARKIRIRSLSTPKALLWVGGAFARTTPTDFHIGLPRGFSEGIEIHFKNANHQKVTIGFIPEPFRLRLEDSFSKVLQQIPQVLNLAFIKGTTQIISIMSNFHYGLEAVTKKPNPFIGFGDSQIEYVFCNHPSILKKTGHKFSLQGITGMKFKVLTTLLSVSIADIAHTVNL